MAVKLECPCGKRFQVSEDHAGRRVRCPACGAAVPVPDAEDDGGGAYEVEAIRKCPRCREEWPGDAVLCVNCGHHFDSGKKMRTTYEVRDRVVEAGVPALGTYTRWTVHRGRRGDLTLSISTRFLFIPFGTQVIDLKGYDSVYTDVDLGDANDNVPDTFHLDIEGPRKRAVQIFSGANEETMHELIDTLREVANLTVKRR